VGVALVAWAAILGGLVPWEGVVATLSMDPAEMMMSMATAGGGEGEEEGGGEVLEVGGREIMKQPSSFVAPTAEGGE